MRQVNPDQSFSAMGLGSGESGNSLMSMAMSTDVFFEMPQNPDLYRDQYQVVAGHWPQNYSECVLVLTSRGTVSDYMLYTLGLRDADELDTMIRQFMNEEKVDIPQDIQPYDYDEILGITFSLVNSSDYYQYDSEYQVWVDKTDDSAYMKKLVENGETLSIVGIVQPAEGAEIAMLNTGIGYTAELTDHVIQAAADSQIVQEQLKQKTINVFTGEEFGAESEESRFDMSTLFTVDEEALAEAFQVDESKFQMDLSGLSGMSVDTSALAGAFSLDMGETDLTDLIDLEELFRSWPRNICRKCRKFQKGWI